MKTNSITRQPNLSGFADLAAAETGAASATSAGPAATADDARGPGLPGWLSFAFAWLFGIEEFLLDPLPERSRPGRNGD